MVSLVIVSHSAALADGVRELASQMVQGQVPIAVAGGIDDPEHPIGTDPMKVLAAIEDVFSPTGVVVLMDLGSALMSAEMALEFLPPEKASRVFLCEAPLVEGAIAAAVQALSGGDAASGLAEARGALLPKQSQLAPFLDQSAPAGTAAAAEDAAGQRETLRLTVPNRLGLHARPAAKLVNLAARFEALIEIRRNGRVASAKSVNQVATLGARQGDELIFTASGPDAAEALQAIQELAAANFGDPDEEPAALAAVRESGPDQLPDGLVRGNPASPGIAIGPIALYHPQMPAVESRPIEDPAAEFRRLLAAIETAKSELGVVRQKAARTAGAAEADIFEAHVLILEDPALQHAVNERISREKINAEAAWLAEIEETAGRYTELEDPYLQARAQDVLDVGQRVLRQLMDIQVQPLTFSRPAILVAEELTPSDTAQLTPENVLGILTARGGATAHSAILARALGIPAVVGATHIVPQLTDGQEIALDGETGQVWLALSAETKEELVEKRASWLAERQAAQKKAQAEAVTADGVRIEVAANIGTSRDAELALNFGAEGVGLYRTEFLFMDRRQPPSEEEQLTAYRAAAAALAGRPLIIRTLDAGGDKPIPYLEIGHEDNPFLGWRALRYCLDHPDIFLPQLRAILRTSADHPVKIMFPMVGSLEELHRAKAVLGEARASLSGENRPFDDDIEVGIMIEIPSAIFVADHLATEVDFFSIGTNDLTQYMMAADRGNARVSGLINAFNPAVIRSIHAAARAAQEHGIWIGMCGEMAGNPLATPLLVGLGLTELSMNAPAIPAVKEALQALTMESAGRIAEKVLLMSSAAEIEQYLRAAAEMFGPPL